MPLGTEVGLGPGDIVLDGDPPPHGKGHSSRHFRPMCIVAKRSPISATAELLSILISNGFFDDFMILLAFYDFTCVKIILHMLHKQLTKVPTEPSNITVSETYITFRTSLVTKG